MSDVLSEKKESIVTDDTENEDGRHVIVTTEYRGVFFGKIVRLLGDTVVLRDARNCIHWSQSTGGFMGLASSGPGDGSRIGAIVISIELRKITSIIEMSSEAVTVWDEFDVYRG